MPPSRHVHEEIPGKVTALPRTNGGTAFAIGIAINTVFVIGELGAGFYTHSMALISDGGHNVGDVLGLLLAWLAHYLASRGPNLRFTYGFGRGTILAALANAGLLLVGVGAIGVEAVRRLLVPQNTSPVTIAVVAGIGILVNGASAMLFADGDGHGHGHGHGAAHKPDMNRRGAFLHMASDAAISAGVVVAALVLWATGWRRIDPAVSLVLALVIAWSTRGLLRQALTMSFDAVPDQIDAAGVRAYLAAIPGVKRLHDLHIWPMSTTRTALTCHVVMDGPPDASFLSSVSAELHARFGIDHTTLQLESEGDPCALAPDHVI